MVYYEKSLCKFANNEKFVGFSRPTIFAKPRLLLSCADVVSLCIPYERKRQMGRLEPKINEETLNGEEEEVEWDLKRNRVSPGWTGIATNRDPFNLTD